MSGLTVSSPPDRRFHRTGLFKDPAPKKYRDEYIIPGSGFRLLVNDIHNLIALYYSLARRLSEAETEKSFLRLKKRAGNYEKEMKQIYRSLGLPEDDAEEALDEGDLEGDEVWSD